MGWFDRFRRSVSGIDRGVEEFRSTEGAVLLDVRTDAEYSHCRIPDAMHLPLSKIRSVAQRIPDRNTPVFVYCRNGVRSRSAVRQMRAMGYSRVRSIGGILNYHGITESG